MATTRNIHGQAPKLYTISSSLVLILIALTVVECSLSTVLQSTGPSASLITKGSMGRVNIGAQEPSILKLPSQSRMADLKSSSDNNNLASISPVSLKPLKFGSSSPTSASMEGANKALEPQQGENFFQKLGGMVKNVIAPARSYVDLVQRYHKWFFNYKKLKSLSSRQLRDPNEILKEEYSKVDELLLEEEAAKHAAELAEARNNDDDGNVLGSGGEDSEGPALEEAKPMDPKRVENMDFVFKALKVLIERLEEKLEELERREKIPIDEDAVSASDAEPENNDERVRAAMERVKKAVMGSAKNLLTGEAAIIARTAMFHGMAQYMEAKPDTGDVLDQLRPIVFMLGSASTPVAVSYLMGLEFRAALAVVDRANPLSLFGINLKKDQPAIA